MTPPHKKQRIDTGKSDADLLALVSRPTTRAAIEAASEALSVVETRRLKKIARRGRLQALLDLSLDVQLEICNYLDLKDLLNLGRTSKNFRAFLLDKANERKLWVPALANTPGIPVRPPFMSTPAFAHLLYSPHCHNCGESKVRDIVYNCFTRLCWDCFCSTTTRPDWAACDADMIDSSGTLSRVIFDNGNRELYRFRDDFVDRVFKEFAALPTPVTLEAVAALAEKARATHRAALPYAHDLHVWMKVQEKERLAGIEAIRKRRYEAILSRLQEAGWKTEIDLMDARKLHALSQLPDVRQASKLTNRAWPKAKIALDEYMKGVQERRLDWEYRILLKTRIDALEKALVAHYVTLPRTARMDYRPQYIDLALTPECRAILDMPASETVTVEQFAVIIPALAQKWDADCRKALTDYLLPYLGDIPVDVDPLGLAISFFSCGPSMPFRNFWNLRYPTAFKHRCFHGDCFRRPRRYTIRMFFEDDVYTRTVKSLHWTEYELERQLESKPYDDLHIYVPWYLRTTADHDRACTVVDIMRRIVSASGLDPVRATFEDLVQSDVWLRCATCETKHPYNEIFARSWKGAYMHEREHVTTGRPSTRMVPEWKQADDDDMIKVRAFKEAESWDADFGFDGWACSLCPTFNATAEAMTTHLETMHAIPDIYQARRDGVVYHPQVDRSFVYADSVSLGKSISPEAIQDSGTH